MSVAGGSTSNVSLMSMGIASGCAFCRVNVWGGRAGRGGDVGLLSWNKEEAKEVVKEEVEDMRDLTKNLKKSHLQLKSLLNFILNYL